jgi:hypothetical protein
MVNEIISSTFVAESNLLAGEMAQIMASFALPPRDS